MQMCLGAASARNDMFWNLQAATNAYRFQLPEISNLNISNVHSMTAPCWTTQEEDFGAVVHQISRAD